LEVLETPGGRLPHRFQSRGQDRICPRDTPPEEDLRGGTGSDKVTKSRQNFFFTCDHAEGRLEPRGFPPPLKRQGKHDEAIAVSRSHLNTERGGAGGSVLSLWLRIYCYFHWVPMASTYESPPVWGNQGVLPYRSPSLSSLRTFPFRSTPTGFPTIPRYSVCAGFAFCCHLQSVRLSAQQGRIICPIIPHSIGRLLRLEEHPHPADRQVFHVREGCLLSEDVPDGHLTLTLHQ